MDIVRTSGNGKRKFTLVELLAVIAIMAVLAGITIGIVPLINQNSADAKTRGIIKAIEVALENYKAKYGYYIPSENGEVNVFNITHKGDLEKINLNFAQFIEYDSMSKDRDGNLLDAYGSPILYRCPGYFNRGGFDIGSLGNDMKLGSSGKTLEWGSEDPEDPDKKSLTSAFISSYKDHFGKGDDITNFKRKTD